MSVISIVTPSYNQAEFLLDCIESVRGGSSQLEVEHIVVDGASSDGTLGLLEEVGSAVDLWWSEPDSGPAAALNKGFKRGSGDIFGCLNADDFLLPGALSKVYTAFEREPEVDVVYGHGILVDEKGQRICRLYSDSWNLKRMLYGRCTVVQQGTFYRRSVFERAGCFNEANMSCWDAELLVDMALVGARFRRLDSFLGAFRLHEGSISGSGRLLEQYRRDREGIRTRIVGKEGAVSIEVRKRLYGAWRAFADPGVAVGRSIAHWSRSIYGRRYDT